MQELFGQLGIDGRLLLAQGVNFFILLIALTFIVYRPLIRLIEERKARIAEGLEKAKEADIRLERIDEQYADRMRAAETEIVKLMEAKLKEADENARKKLIDAEHHAAILFERAKERIRREHSEALSEFEDEAKILLKEAIVRLVELKPQMIDDALIAEAAGVIQKKRITS